MSKKSMFWCWLGPWAALSHPGIICGSAVVRYNYFLSSTKYVTCTHAWGKNLWVAYIHCSQRRIAAGCGECLPWESRTPTWHTYVLSWCICVYTYYLNILNSLTYWQDIAEARWEQCALYIVVSCSQQTQTCVRHWFCIMWNVGIFIPVALLIFYFT